MKPYILEAPFSYFLALAAGLALAVGLLHLYVGLKEKERKTSLFFGLISISASFFYMLRILGGVFEWPSWSMRLVYGLVFLFYGFFPWFISYLSGYSKRRFNQILSGTVVLSYILLWVDDTLYGPLPLWDWLAMLIVNAIGIYGILAVRHMFLKKTRSKGITYLFLLAVAIYDLLLIHYHVNKLFGIELLFPREFGGIAAMDFFPLFFLLLMGIQLGRDVYGRLILEKKLQVRDQYINNLLENLEDFVLLLDVKGKIINANAYFLRKTGRSIKELEGADFVDLLSESGEKEHIQNVFLEAQQGSRNEVPSFLGVLQSRKGYDYQVQWSPVSRFDMNGSLIGFLCIGYDLTEKEKAFKEVKQLKLELEKENLQLQEMIQSLQGQETIIGQSDSLNYALTRARQVAPTDASVLIKGETGVGKELFAELIHHNSQRATKPLVKVNCASLPRDLIESELFGHEKGAFTGAHSARKGRFELADGGTLFLDEIGELPLELQPKLLRALQQGEFMRLGGQKVHKVDVRVISATNRNLKEEVQSKRFREDLFYRLDVYPITIPPLRQRKEDIPLLVQFFVKKYTSNKELSQVDISRRDLRLLNGYHWPGNVRELQNVVERAMINSPEGNLRIDPADLENMGSGSSLSGRSRDEAGFSLGQSLEEVEREHILRVLEDCNWKISGKEGAAKRLGIPRTTLQSRMKKLGIERPKEVG